MPTRNHSAEWIFPKIFDVPGYFRSQIGGYSIVSQTLLKRGLSTLKSAQGYLYPDLYSPAPPKQLPGVQKAADRLQTAISKKENILVWGDFDVDGQTSTALLVTALRELGGDVFFYIPNRARESHGIPLSSFKTIVERYQPSLVITCDTGIDAFDSINFAQSTGIDVIITDHHQLPKELPPAYAVVNPNLLSEDHPLFSLPGVGVAYKVIEELFGPENHSTDHFLDFVALGIVADIAQLSGDTRYLLQRGLPILSKSPRLGLNQLYENANLKPETLTEEQISFVIAPRLNALGRLDDANSCVDFFTTTDLRLASELAKRLEDLNAQRQQLTEVIFKDAIELLNSNPELHEDFPVIVLDGPPSWNPGVIGIVASRLVDQFHQPVIMLSQEGDQARGSARSIEGVSISDLITSTSDLLTRYGGHPMAAGLSLPRDNISKFRRSLANSYRYNVGEDLPVQQVIIDEVLPLQSISTEYIKEFHRLAPFGAGNPNLLFATRGVSVLSDKIIGKNLNHRKLIVKDSPGTSSEILWWNSSDIDIPPGPIDIAYSLSISTYRGQEQNQITLKHLRQSSAIPIIVKETKPTIIDHRHISNPSDILPTLTSEYSDLQVWAEFNKPENIISQPRFNLIQSPNLLVWTPPPSLNVFRNVLENVSPSKIILVANTLPEHNNRAVLDLILGMLRHLQDSGRDFDPELFAQSIAQTSALIQTGLDWFHNHGDYDLSLLRNESKILPGSGIPKDSFNNINDRFILLLNEITSYRAYFNSADKRYLL